MQIVNTKLRPNKSGKSLKIGMLSINEDDDYSEEDKKLSRGFFERVN